MVASSPHFHRAMAGVTTPNGVRVHIAGIDLVRGRDGIFRVLEDNVRSPSGVSYVMTNRRAVHAALPEIAAKHRIRPVDDYPSQLLTALRAAAPSSIADPTVVVLTPGVHNSAYFEHAMLARMMGVELVEGRDLVAARRPRVAAHHPGPAPGARHLPAHRRRVPRPGRVPGRLPLGVRRARSTRREPGT